MSPPTPQRPSNQTNPSPAVTLFCRICRQPMAGSMSQNPSSITVLTTYCCSAKCCEQASSVWQQQLERAEKEVRRLEDKYGKDHEYDEYEMNAMDAREEQRKEALRQLQRHKDCGWRRKVDEMTGGK
jgi:hypothetical protein